MFVEAVERRVVVDVAHTSGTRRSPDRSPEPPTPRRRPTAGRWGCPCCRRLALIDANWASIADHNLASRSDPRRGGCGASRTPCRPTVAPTPTPSACRSSASPSSPAKRLPNSRQRRSNTVTGSTRANPNNRVLQLAETSPPRTIQTLRHISDGVDMTRRHITRSQRCLEARHLLTHLRTIPDAAFVSRTERRPYPVNTSAADSQRPSAANSREPARDRHIDRINPTPHPLRQRHRRTQTSPVTRSELDRQQPGDRLADTTIIHHRTPLDPHDQTGEAGYQPP